MGSNYLSLFKPNQATRKENVMDLFELSQVTQNENVMVFSTGALLEARNAWCGEHLDSETVALCQRNGIEVPRESSGDDVVWGDWTWHLKNRLTDKNVDDFLALFPEYQGQEVLLRKYLESYDLSILPLNLLQAEGVRKFLPRIGLIPAPDPYGVQRERSVVLREEGGKKFYLSTHKPGYASFLPILGGGAGRVFCQLGCGGCYRGPQTRFGEPLSVIHADETRETVWIPKPEQQAEWLVEEWNTRPEFSGVYDILFSGGEPMMLPNDVWRKILAQMEEAKHLRSFRICTGALFLGLPFRFDDGFIQLLSEFRKRTGIQVKLSVHVSHPEHITPEAVYFARRLIRKGIELLPQCPLEPGVNFWVDDIGKTVETLRRLDRRLALVVGTRPFKWIIDMQGGVSLLSVVEVWRRIHDRHQMDSDITRPTSFALFLPREEGNLNLGYHSFWAMEMQVDAAAGRVHYRIPHPAGVWVDYTEPIWPGINDDPSRLAALRI